MQFTISVGMIIVVLSPQESNDSKIITGKKVSNYSRIIFIKSVTHYFQNYSGIIGSSLLGTNTMSNDANSIFKMTSQKHMVIKHCNNFYSHCTYSSIHPPAIINNTIKKLSHRYLIVVISSVRFRWYTVISNFLN